MGYLDNNGVAYLYSKIKEYIAVQKPYSIAVGNGEPYSVWKGTYAEYCAITPDESTIYIITTPPYDAEIEYLESTDETKLVTDITFTSTTELTCTFSLGVPGRRVFLCGVYSTDRDGYWCVGSTGYVERTYQNNSKVFVGDNNKHVFVRARQVKEVDGTNIQVSIPADDGWFSHPNNPLTFFSHMSTAEPSGGIKLHSAQVKNGNVLVSDLIPVRVGNVGYMYDRVSGQLFGNSGTGSFILGPDKH